MSTATMSSTTFFSVDTLQLSKRLQKSGLDQKISEEFAEIIKETHNQSLEGLATKEDLKTIEQNSKHSIQDLRQDIKALESNVKKDLEMLEQRVVIKLGRMVYISTAFITTIIGLAVALIKF